MTDEISFSPSERSLDRRAKAHRAWRSAESIKRLSDRLIGIGPIGLGLDGVLAWCPAQASSTASGRVGCCWFRRFRPEPRPGRWRG